MLQTTQQTLPQHLDWEIFLPIPQSMIKTEPSFISRLKAQLPLVDQGLKLHQVGLYVFLQIYNFGNFLRNFLISININMVI